MKIRTAAFRPRGASPDATNVIFGFNFLEMSSPQFSGSTFLEVLPWQLHRLVLSVSGSHLCPAPAIVLSPLVSCLLCVFSLLVVDKKSGSLRRFGIPSRYRSRHVHIRVSGISGIRSISAVYAVCECRLFHEKRSRPVR